jgi:hypothetical protein
MSEEKNKSDGAHLDEIEAAKKAEAAIAEAEAMEEQIRSNNLKNVSLTEADLHMFGDRIVLAQVTQLLSYIRHAVKNNLKAEIQLVIDNSDSTVANAEFMFDVNGCQVPDCVTQSKWWIN